MPERLSLWTSTYADWDHDILDVDTSKPIEINEEALRASLAALAEQLRPFQTPPGCAGCGGCRTCLVVLP